MKFSIIHKLISVACAASFLSGCGALVPDIQEVYESPDAPQKLVDAIVEQVECEVKTSVQYVILQDMELAEDPNVLNALRKAGLKTGRKLDWLDKWAAQVTLTLTIDEKGAANPGLAFNTPIIPAVTTFPGKVTVTTPQSYSLGLGGTFSADATRKETLSLYIDFQKFTDKASLKLAKARFANGIPPCGPTNGVFIQSDLKLREWLADVTLPAYVQGGVTQDYSASLAKEAKVSKKDAISHEITFVILYSGNITPTWKLVRVSANAGSLPLFNAQRTKTQDLLITLGEAQADGLSTAAQNTILASQIGTAVANAIRNTQ